MHMVSWLVATQTPPTSTQLTWATHGRHDPTRLTVRSMPIPRYQAQCSLVAVGAFYHYAHFIYCHELPVVGKRQTGPFLHLTVSHNVIVRHSNFNPFFFLSKVKTAKLPAVAAAIAAASIAPITTPVIEVAEPEEPEQPRGRTKAFSICESADESLSAYETADDENDDDISFVN